MTYAPLRLLTPIVSWSIMASMDTNKTLTHSHMREVSISYINAATSARERADRVARTRRILEYLHHRQLRAALKKNGGFWGRSCGT